MWTLYRIKGQTTHRNWCSPKSGNPILLLASLLWGHPEYRSTWQRNSITSFYPHQGLQCAIHPAWRRKLDFQHHATTSGNMVPYPKDPIHPTSPWKVDRLTSNSSNPQEKQVANQTKTIYIDCCQGQMNSIFLMSFGSGTYLHNRSPPGQPCINGTLHVRAASKMPLWDLFWMCGSIVLRMP